MNDAVCVDPKGPRPIKTLDGTGDQVRHVASSYEKTEDVSTDIARSVGG